MSEEGQDVMNRDKGVFLLSHVYDLLLSTATAVATPSGESSFAKSNSYCQNYSCCRNVTNSAVNNFACVSINCQQSSNDTHAVLVQFYASSRLQLNKIRGV